MVYDVVVCLSVYVISWCSAEMAKHMITQTVPQDSPGTLVFCCWTGVIPNRGAKCRWGTIKLATFDK